MAMWRGMGVLEREKKSSREAEQECVYQNSSKTHREAENAASSYS